MNTGAEVDGVLVQWGERLFYPGNRIVRSAPTPRLSGSVGQRAAAIRQRIHATVVRRAPQVMVKVTGGGRGMAAIAAHFRYISKSGRLPFEDDRGVDPRRQGGAARPGRAMAVRRLVHRRDEPSARGVQHHAVDAERHRSADRAARGPGVRPGRARDHRYVMVLHDHQANPHVHISVRAESGTASGSIRARPTCSAGARPSPRSCAAGASMPRRPGSDPRPGPQLRADLARQGGGGGTTEECRASHEVGRRDRQGSRPSRRRPGNDRRRPVQLGHSRGPGPRRACRSVPLETFPLTKRHGRGTRPQTACNSISR